MWYQVQNGGNAPVNYDLAVPQRAGLFAGVWGVTYAEDDHNNNPRQLTFHQQNEILGQQATKLNADAVMVDAEDCLKYTRNFRGAKPMIDGIRSGGWLGPIHLTTLGAPYDPLVDDYVYDLESFLETGGGIFAQAYAQAASSYAPQPTKLYYCERMGVPVERYNTMIWMDGRLTAQAQVDLLKHASTGRAVSVFMTEYASDAEWDVLDSVTKILTSSPVDPRLTLDPTMCWLRDEAFREFLMASTKNPENWAHANPREWKVLQNYLLYRVAFNLTPPPVDGWTKSIDPPANCSTRIGRGMADQLMAAAALLGRV